MPDFQDPKYTVRAAKTTALTVVAFMLPRASDAVPFKSVLGLLCAAAFIGACHDKGKKHRFIQNARNVGQNLFGGASAQEQGRGDARNALGNVLKGGEVYFDKMKKTVEDGVQSIVRSF